MYGTKVVIIESFVYTQDRTVCSKVYYFYSCIFIYTKSLKV